MTNARFGWKADIDLTEITTETSVRMKGLRYLLYLAFVVGALVFWFLVLMFMFDFVPIPLAKLAWWEELFRAVVLYGAIPATVLVFVFYRRWIRRKLGMDED